MVGPEMIEKLDLNWAGPRNDVVNDMIVEKINEVIDFLNQEDEFEKACKKAAKTGSHEDLKKYLDLRRKYLWATFNAFYVERYSTVYFIPDLIIAPNVAVLNWR